MIHDDFQQSPIIYTRLGSTSVAFQSFIMFLRTTTAKPFSFQQEQKVKSLRHYAYQRNILIYVGLNNKNVISTDSICGMQSITTENPFDLFFISSKTTSGYLTQLSIFTEKTLVFLCVVVFNMLLIQIQICNLLFCKCYTYIHIQHKLWCQVPHTFYREHISMLWYQSYTM